MSSTYLTCPPNCLSKVLSTFLSMYSGQLENVQLPIGTFGWRIAAAATGVASLRARSSVPSIPHPAREPASASKPARPRKTRRVVRGSVTGDHERVLRAPRQLDVAPDAERVGLRAFRVLREHVELLAARGGDDVLDRGAQKRGDDDLAAQDVGAVGHRVTRRHQPDLLRPHAHADLGGP